MARTRGTRRSKPDQAAEPIQSTVVVAPIGEWAQQLPDDSMMAMFAAQNLLGALRSLRDAWDAPSIEKVLWMAGTSEIPGPLIEAIDALRRAVRDNAEPIRRIEPELFAIAGSTQTTLLLKRAEHLAEACERVMDNPDAQARNRVAELIEAPTDMEWLRDVTQSEAVQVANHRGDGADKDRDYEGPQSPADWCKQFRMSATKFRNLRKSGAIIARPLTTKSLYVHKASIAKYSAGPRGK